MREQHSHQVHRYGWRRPLSSWHRLAVVGALAAGILAAMAVPAQAGADQPPSRDGGETIGSMDGADQLLPQLPPTSGVRPPRHLPTHPAVLLPTPARAKAPYGLVHTTLPGSNDQRARGTTTAAAEPRVLPQPTYYLALGASESVGVQPTTAAPHGAPTAAGYADDVAADERSRWPGLQLVRIGCPGETSQTMVAGGDRCSYPDGSQLATAVDFLRTHPSTVLVTVDIGFNDLHHCFLHHQVHEPCVDQALDGVDQQLPTILATLRSAASAAGDSDLRIVGVGHNNPYLGAYVGGEGGRTLAADSMDVLDRLNQTLQAIYAAAGIPMADVAQAFESSDTALTTDAPSDPTDAAATASGPVPVDVAKICSLTWMCAPRPYGPNIHPNAAGYLVIARAIEQVLGR